MNKTDIFNYQRNGVFKAGREIVVPGNIRNGVRQPDEVRRTGMNFLGHVQMSELVLQSIRNGINNFFFNTDSLANVSVMSKYLATMKDANGECLLTDFYSERMIPAVYETCIANTIRSFTGGGINYPMIMAHASELCWDWCCLFWYEDQERTLADNEWALDFASRGVRVRDDYFKLRTEINSGFDLYYNGEELKNHYIEAKEQSMAKVVTLSGIAEGKHVTGKINMDDIEVYKHLAPDVLERLERDERENNRKLEVEARAKRTVKAMTSNVKVHSDDAPMKASMQMLDVQSKPIVIKQPLLEESEMLYPAQQQQQSILTNYMGQPITTQSGQALNINPGALAGVQGNIQQKVINNTYVYDNTGLPIVVVINAHGQEQLIDLNGQQYQFYQTLLNQAQQPQGGLVPQQHQPQQQSLVPQQNTAPANNANSGQYSDIPGMEFAGSVEFATTQAPKAQDNTHLGLVDAVYQPAAGETQPVSTGSLVPQDEPKAEVSGMKEHHFLLNVDGEDYPAALLEDEEYVSQKLMPVEVMVGRTHARGVVYLDDKVEEFVVNRESFMNREKHLGYILHQEKGEYLQRNAGPAVVENSAETAPDYDYKAKMTKQELFASSLSELITTAAIAQAREGNGETLAVSRFTMRETLPFVDLKQDTVDALFDNSEESKFTKLLNILEVTNHNQDYVLTAYLMKIADWWITDVIYNRIGVPRSSNENISYAGDYVDYHPYLVGEGKWDMVEAEMEKDWPLFFNLETEVLSFIPDDEEETEEDEVVAEEPESKEVDPRALAEELLAEGDETETVVEDEEDASMQEIFIKETSGYIVNIEGFLPPEDLTTNALIDPASSISLWQTMNAAFNAIPFNATENQYLYLSTGSGDLCLMKCEDPELGYYRMIGSRKL